MLIGTHTSDCESNYLQIASVHLPKGQQELSVAQYDEDRGGESISLIKMQKTE